MHSENEKAIYVNMLDLSSQTGTNEYGGKIFFHLLHEKWENGENFSHLWDEKIKSIVKKIQ